MKMDINKILSILSIIVTIVACFISYHALKISKSQFIAEKRPYLVVAPAKFSKSDKYLEIEKTKDGKATLHFQLKIENIGNVAATSITSEALPVFGRQAQILTTTDIIVNPLELGPGQHVYRNYILRFSGEQTNYAKATTDSLKKNPMEIWESFRYSSEVNNTVVYETRIGYRVSVEDVNLLFQETKRISDSIIMPRP
jgi:hypothetical protein